MEQYGFYASWEEAKKEKFPVLCYLVSHCVPFSILLKLYQTLGVRGQEKDSMYRPIFLSLDFSAYDVTYILEYNICHKMAWVC